MNKILLGVSFGLGLSAFADLPADLAQVQAVYDAIAVPMDQQVDLEFKVAPETLTGRESTHLRKILSAELKQAEDDTGPSIDSILGRRIYLTDRASPTDLDSEYLNSNTLAQRIMGNEEGDYGPYYCGSLKINSIDGGTGEAVSAGCLAETAKLTQKIQELGLSVKLVEVDGDWYGIYRYKALYVQSATEPTKYLRFFFDILHEI